MKLGAERLLRWTALARAALLACAVVLFQVAHVTAAPAPPVTATPCHAGPGEAASKAKEGHAGRACAMQCSALFLPSLPPLVIGVFAPPHEAGRIASLVSRQLPAPERPPKA